MTPTTVVIDEPGGVGHGWLHEDGVLNMGAKYYVNKVEV